MIIRMNVASPWPEVAQKLARSDVPVAFTPEQEDCLKLLGELLPTLLSGQTGLRLDEEAIKQFCLRLGKCPAARKKERFNFVARGIEWGNRHLDWDIPLSPFFFSVNRDRNFLQPEVFQNRHRAERLTAAFIAHLEQRPNSGDEWLGRILLSAILFGGLLNLRWQTPFIQSLAKAEIYQEGSWLWLEMVRPAGKRSPPRQGRWVADPLTQLLIYRVLESGSGEIRAGSPWRLAKALIDRLPLGGDERPKSLPELLRWALSLEILRSGSGLLGHARGSLDGTPLPIGPWLRFLTGKSIPVEKQPPQRESSTAVHAEPILSPERTSIARQIALFKQAYALLTPGEDGKEISIGNGQNRLKMFFAEHRREMGPALQLLIQWGQQMLSSRVFLKERRTAPAIKTSSLARYWTEIGGTLVRSCGLESPLLMDPQDLEDLYETIAMKLGNEPYAIHRLAQFHGFLEAFHKAPAMEWTEVVDEYGKICSSVDANLVNPAIYEALLASLGWGEAEPTRRQTLHLLATILSYRCGLRPVEIRAMRIMDIQGVTKYEALIRNNRFKTTKTSSGVRRLPLSLLLTEQEMAFLLGYREQRKGEAGLFGEELFLAHPTKKAGMLGDGELFGPIREHLRTITRDDSLRSYHLRHSFLTWGYVSFFLGGEHPPEDVAALDHPQFEHTRRQVILENLLQQPSTGRSYPFLLAMLAGHSSPRTTHHSYIHLMDWLCAFERRQPHYSRAVPVKSLTALTNLSKPRVYALLQEGKKTGHVLLPILMTQAPSYAQRLRHPLMEKARAPRKMMWKEDNHTLPDWAEVVAGLRDLPEDLQRAMEALTRPDWELAAQLYDGVRQLDGRRQKSARKIIETALNNLSPRWKDSVYTTFSSAKEIAGMLLECGLVKSQLLVVHHPRRGQTEKEQQEFAYRWASAVGLGENQIQKGEDANFKKTPQRGCITLKILTEPQLHSARRRMPKGSPGYLLALRLLHHQFSHL